MINIEKLHRELADAGIAISGVSENGKVWNLQNEEIQDTPEVAAVLEAHDPKEYLLRPNYQVIVGNGAHTAVVEAGVLYSVKPPKTDKIEINGEEQTIDLDNGLARLFFTSSTPGTVIKLAYHGLYAIVEVV